MATAASSSRKPAGTPSKPLEKLKEKAAKPDAAGAPAAAKPEGVKGAKPAALPDTTLLDGDAENPPTPPPPRGLAAWLPAGRKRWLVLGGAAGGLMGMVAAVALAAAHLRSAPPPPKVTVITGPAHAVDGGTVTIAGQTVRLDAIEAPPAALICREGAWKFRCGDAARRALDGAIGGSSVECVRLHTDGRGRLAALCRNDSGLDLAAIQVESGWAVNDIETSSRYVAEQWRAENERSGLWRNDFAHPELWHESASAGR